MRIKYKLVQTIDLDEIRLADSSALNFRIEVLENIACFGSFVAVVYRLESFKMIPSYCQINEGNIVHSDQELFVVDDFFRQFSFESDSASGVIDQVISKMSELFEK